MPRPSSKSASTKPTGKRPDRNGQERSTQRLGLLGGGGSDRGASGGGGARVSGSSGRNRSSKVVSKRGEQVNVKPTKKAIPIGPERAPLPAPTVAAAIDHRRQIVGIDDPKPSRKRAR